MAISLAHNGIHTQQQKTCRQTETPFELMFGDSPVAILLLFENTKYPSIEQKMATLLHNQEEALASKESYSRTAEIDFYPIQKG